MKKRLFIGIILIFITIIILWLVGIRIHMPFSTISPSKWNTITIQLAGVESVVVTDPDDINALSELLSDLSITTVGVGNNRSGYAFCITINSSSYVFSGDTVTKLFQYRISSNEYLEDLRELYENFKMKYGVSNPS
ncbi:hypothetical protein NDGK_02270 [Clostridiales bacterium CHKCI001]|nr:hypothetical protein NDGK_02270 [Clostridiales bacterium CHKCI001]